MSASMPTSVPVFTVLSDDQDDILAEHQNTPNDEITALATMIGALGKAQSWGTDILSALVNGAPPMFTKTSGVTNSITVSAGTAWVANAAQSIRLPRRLTASTTITASNIDTGAMAVGFYYIYAVGETVGTTPTFVFSTSASAPTGYLNYELYGWFYNETSSVLDVTNAYVGNVKRNGHYGVPNAVSRNSSTVFTMADQTFTTKETLYFYTSGRPLLFYFQGNSYYTGSNDSISGRIAINASEDSASESTCYCSSGDAGGSSAYLRDVYILMYPKVGQAAGALTIDFKFRRGGSNAETKIANHNFGVIEL